MRKTLFRRGNNQRGAALIEGALVLPILLLVGVCIFEFGRAYQTWQVITNAAREGARIAVLAGSTDTAVRNRVQTYASNGAVPAPPGGWTSRIAINRTTAINYGPGTAMGTTITITYPFSFMVLRPVSLLVHSPSTLGNAITLHATATMRNE